MEDPSHKTLDDHIQEAIEAKAAGQRVVISKRLDGTVKKITYYNELAQPDRDKGPAILQFHPNGQTAYAGEYHNEDRYCPNGDPTTYTWYENGQLSSRMIYSDYREKPKGIWGESWHEDGSPQMFHWNRPPEEGPSCISWYPSGKIAYISYTDPTYETRGIEWDEEGNFIEEDEQIF